MSAISLFAIKLKCPKCNFLKFTIKSESIQGLIFEIYDKKQINPEYSVQTNVHCIISIAIFFLRFWMREDVNKVLILRKTESIGQQNNNIGNK